MIQSFPYKLYFFLLLIFYNPINPIDQKNTVEHKNFELNLYLDKIKYNIEEKIGLLEYILKNPHGTYLEIGTGGDPIMSIFKQLPPTAQTSIIAADIDSTVLDSLPNRHPELKKYIHNACGPHLKLQQLNATNLHIFKNNSLDGINASAIVHEIISYAGGYDGTKKFFLEAFRTLKPHGILCYRDPEFLSEKEKTSTIFLQTKSIRLFTHIFLYKFLDTSCSVLAQQKNKFNLYNTKDIYITFYKKNRKKPICSSFEKYLHIPTLDIDFSKPYYIQAPLGIYREIARHYLTYLHACNPLVYVHFTPEIHSGKYRIDYLAHSTEKILYDFLSQQNKKLQNNHADSEIKNSIEREIESSMHVIESGITLHCNSEKQKNEFKNLLKKYKFKDKIHIIKENKNSFVLDYRIFGLLFEQIPNIININESCEKKDVLHAQWLKREGEEFYFYYSVDELITHILDITLNESIQKNETFVLCPIYNIHIERLCYTELLRNCIFVQNNHKDNVIIQDGKRVIHFAKLKLDEAITYYENTIQKNPHNYPKLKKYLEKIKKENNG